MSFIDRVLEFQTEQLRGLEKRLDVVEAEMNFFSYVRPGIHEGAYIVDEVFCDLCEKHNDGVCLTKRRQPRFSLKTVLKIIYGEELSNNDEAYSDLITNNLKNWVVSLEKAKLETLADAAQWVKEHHYEPYEHEKYFERLVKDDSRMLEFIEAYKDKCVGQHGYERHMELLEKFNQVVQGYKWLKEL